MEAWQFIGSVHSLNRVTKRSGLSSDWQLQDRCVIGLVEDRLDMPCSIKVCMLKPIFKCSNI